VPFSLVTLLFFVAFVTIFVGMLLMTLSSLSNLSDVSSGTVILIGPIPIVIGSGSYSWPLVVLAVALTVFSVVFFFLLRRKR